MKGWGLHVLRREVCFRFKSQFAESCAWSSMLRLDFRVVMIILMLTDWLFVLGESIENATYLNYAWRMDLYNQLDAMTEGFGVFPNHCHRQFLNAVNSANWWTTIANGVYIPSVAQEGDIRSSIHMLIHRFISCSIYMRKGRWQGPEPWSIFLWSIITPITFCNIPYCFAKYLAEGGVKDRNISSIFWGLFVAKLARSYGIFANGARNFLTIMQTRPFSTLLYKKARIEQDNGGGNFLSPVMTR